MAKDIDLYIGVKNDLSPFTIDLKALTRGLVIIGQSGCGKSFLIGRLVEEIIRNTTDKTRILFIDPNSDFTYGTELKTIEEFDKCLNKYSTGFLTEEYKKFKKREKDCFKDFEIKKGYKPQIFGRGEELNLSWGWLVGNYLRFLQITKANIFSPGYLFAAKLNFYYLKNKSSVDNIEMCYQLSNKMIEIKSLKEKNNNKSTDIPDSTLDEEYKIEVPTYIDMNCLLELLSDIGELRDSKIWRTRKLDHPPINIFANECRINFIELETIKLKKIRLIIIAYILKYLYEFHVNIIEKCRNSEDKNNKSLLKHTFILIDEAHNFAPENTSDPHEKMLGELIHTIAAEGRKYGLHLILATQRPNKIKQGLLGECDNAIIMKMNSRSDLEHLSNEMRILDVKLLEPCLHFQGQGNALAVGEMTKMAPYVQLFKSAPRRTKEGGVDIEDF